MEEVIRENEGYYLGTNNFFIKVFSRMFLGLLITAFVSYFAFSTGLYFRLPLGIIAIAEIAIVLIFSFLFRKLSPAVVTFLFYTYAVVNGITFGYIFMIYQINTIIYAFLTTAALFGGLALYGYTTNRDISKFSTIFTVTLIVGLVFSVINIFIGNTILDIILDWVMLLVFAGLTIYDMNKLKNISQIVEYNTDKLYIYGAMELYLDFINMFLRILKILARNRKN